MTDKKSDQRDQTVPQHINIIGDGNVVGDHNVVTVIKYLVQGVRRLPTDYGTRIENFLVEYLGTQEHPVPFGGRDTALAELDTWLDDPDAPPYLLLTAPAGRGKSALLARWSQALAEHKDALAVLFMPVSVRFRTNLSSVVFASLVARLAHLHGDEVPTTSESAEIWRGMVSSYLARPLPDGRRLLVILDGVDEAADWDVGPDLFSLTPPEGLRIVMSARQTAERPTEDTWRHALGWEQPNLARAIDLTPLDRAGVADVLERMGVPLDVLAHDVNITTELYRLSEGDPLLVRLYVDELWARGEAATRLRLGDLRQIEPGLAGYFNHWWEDQEGLWEQKKKDPLRRTEVERVFYALATAMGPLPQDTLSVLAELSSLRLRRALQPLKRFVTTSSNQGYVFVHPKLGLYFWEKVLFDKERRYWEQKFLTWGKNTLEELESRRMQPVEVPSYLLQYYGAHLERVDADIEGLKKIISEVWQQAWFASTGVYDGFLNDVSRTLRAAQEINTSALIQSQPVAYLGLEMRCVFCRVSVNSLTDNFSADLLRVLVSEGIFSIKQGLSHVRRIKDEEQRAETLSALLEDAPENVGEEAWDLIWSFDEQSYSLRIATEILPKLDSDRAFDVFLRLIHAKTDSNEESESLQQEPLIGSGKLVSKMAEAGYVEELLKMVRFLMDPEFDFTKLVASVANSPDIPLEIQSAFIHEFREVMQVLGKEYLLVHMIDQLLDHIPEAQREKWIRRALHLARSVPEKTARVQCLRVVIKLLPRQKQEAVLDESLNIAHQIEEHVEQADALAELAQHASGDRKRRILREALTKARRIDDGCIAEKAISFLKGFLQEQYKKKRTKDRYIFTYEDLINILPIAVDLPDQPVMKVNHCGQVQVLDSHRVFALSSIIPHLTALSQFELYQCFQVIMQACSYKKRDVFLEILVSITPTIYILGGEKAIIETSHAIQDVTEWWP